MKESKSFKEMMLGFFYAINEVTSNQFASLDELGVSKLEGINSKVHSLLKERLPTKPWWQSQDEHYADLMICPYEVCEDHSEPFLGGEFAAFSFWIFSEQPIRYDVGLLFKAEVDAAYAEVAAAHAGSAARFLYAETQVTEQVVSTTLITFHQASTEGTDR